MSELRADTITASDGTSPVTLTKQQAAKVWFSLDGDASTPVFFDSFNCASITDTVGKPKIHFTNSMSNDDFAASGLSGENTGASLSFGSDTPKTTSTVIFKCMDSAFSVGDTTNLDSIIVGDLA